MSFIKSILFCSALLFIRCGGPTQKEGSIENNVAIEDSCCKKVNTEDSLKEAGITSTQSEITCPKCGYKKVETLPTEVCQLSYTCQKCGNIMHPKDGDCCVFCSYGDHKCPSKQ